MLTILTVEKENNLKWYIKLLKKIRGNSILTETKNSRGIVFRHITYKNRTGRINWEKLDDIIGAQRNHLVCNDDIDLPKEMGYRRFENTEFKGRLASNLALCVLGNFKEPQKLKVGIFDPKGENVDIVAPFLEYTSNVVVVSDNLKEFKCEINRVYEETGATVQLTSNRVNLLDCQLIIAPCVIEETLPIKGDTLILTIAMPTQCVSGLVYYDYYVQIPSRLEQIKPSELSNEYFLGALYSKAGQFRLGSMIPLSCKNNSSTHTFKSISNYLEKYLN